ncbi:hypothetical protein RND81_06G242400 [Saponaria officinalis]|uniref:Uncharacterized protein n=1 Tax=Saponaria officinalis TaxID=3572 RepID=A0AAW1KAV4_SAPOF
MGHLTSFLHLANKLAERDHHISFFGGVMTLSERLNISFKECDVVAIKTCGEMEGGYYEFLKKHMNHKSILLENSDGC